LNFGEDITHKPTTAQEWDEHYKEVFKRMIGSENASEDVIVINYNVKKLG